MAAGAAANLSASRRAYLLYSAPALAPLVVRFFLMGDPLHFAMGGMLALYGLILFRVSQNSYQINRTSLLLRFENRGMVEEMRSAKEHTDELNERLLAEMAATEKAKRELRVHRDLLEREVEQRTTDIVCANDQLRVEIEERKQTEQALRESERRLSHAQGLAHIGNWERSFLTAEEFWSDEAYRILGLNPRECEPSYQEFLSRVHPGDRERIEEKIRRVLREYNDYEFDCRIVAKSGEERFVHVTAQVKFAPNGRPVRIIGTVQDVTEQHRANEELQRSREELRTFASHLQSVIENERTTIAREIHDELAQALTVMKIDLVDLAGDFRETGGEEGAAVRGKVRAMTSYIDEVIRKVHRIAMELRPSLLDDLGLEAAIEWQLAEFREKTKIRGELKGSLADSALPRDMATALFRIFQEALTNVARHADADSIEIGLRSNGERIFLSVRDNGKGIEEESLAHARSLGILGMQERVAVLGGELSINGAKGKGTTVLVSLPLRGCAA